MPGLLTFVALSWAAQEITDAQILDMGRDAWIARHRSQGTDALVGAEKRFSLALAQEKERRIAASPDRALLDEVDILLSNLTKGACRVADYRLYDTPDFLLINAKASTAMVMAMDDIVRRRPTSVAVTQADVWTTFRDVQSKHRESFDVLEAYRARHGGYSNEQLMREVAALGWFVDKTIRLTAGRSEHEKRHLFRFQIKMLRLTLGEDPLPSPAE